MRKASYHLSLLGLFMFCTGNLFSQVAIDPGDPANRTDIPDFFKSGLAAIEEEVSQLRKGEVEVIAYSPGGLPVYAVYYGEKENFPTRANYNSAVGARDHTCYARRDSSSRPVVFFLGPVHGQEVEGIVGLVNLIHIAETGKDYRGKEWLSLQQKMEKCRIIMVPCGNPDGRRRCPYDTFLGLPTRIMTKYGQGTRKDGSFWGWPKAKSLHPMKGNVGILGAYFNDDGINPMHDEFFSPMAVETRAILDLARNEAPDMAVSLHSHEHISRILPAYYIPWFMKEQIQELTRQLNQNYRSHDLPSLSDKAIGEPSVEDRDYPPKTSFNLVSALHHTSGCMPFVFECTHGSVSDRTAEWEMSFEDILDIQLILYEAMIDYILHQP
jgi:hypothetical protein